MRRMSVLLQYVPQTGVGLEDYSTRLAFCRMGFGHGWSVEDWKEWFHSSACGSQQVYQVDRSQAYQKFRFQYGCQFHQRVNIPIWCPAQHHHRQQLEL